MKRVLLRTMHFITILLILAGLALVMSTNASARTNVSAPSQSVVLSIGGGPDGGTFRYIAAAIAEYVSQTYPEIEMFSETSGGSMENIQRLYSAKFDLAIAYAGDLSMGMPGKLPEDHNLNGRIQPVGYLYGAPAQLVVHANSGIRSIMDLPGKKVAVGNPGSGAARSAERFFKHMGIWGRTKKLHLGYATAARAFNNGRIDAFWVLVGYPNTSVNIAAAHQPIALVPLGDEAEDSGFYETYGLYTPTSIPAGTYPGVDLDSPSFQDSALLCARAGVNEGLVYKVARAIWSPDGLAYIGKAHRAARNMTVDNGLHGITTPLSRGAAKFWRENDITISADITPQ